MRIDLEFVELHSPLFLANTNFGTKLYSGNKGNKGNESLELWYETELEHTFVVCKGKVAMIETTASKTVKDHSQLEKYITLKVPAKGLFKNEPTDAQASIGSLPKQNPQVAGPGVGITGAQVEVPHQKVQNPGRRPKYQGEAAE